MANDKTTIHSGNTLPAKYVVETKTTLNIRLSPNGSIIGVLYPQDEIVVYQIDDTWAKFKYDIGKVEYAYCSAKHISYVEPCTNKDIKYSILDKYRDKNDILDKDSVAYCLQHNYINVVGDMFYPNETITKEQFCTAIYKIMNSKE